MSGTQDTNWKSFVGPQDNNRLVRSTDWLAPEFPRDWDDLFKCSNVAGLEVVGLTIPASREDSVDCVRGTDYRFKSCTIKGSVTFKGAIVGWMLSRCVISGTVEVGQYDNYWYPGRPPTCGGRMNECCAPDGTKIRVKLWDATPPLVMSTDIEVTRIPFPIWFPYFMNTILGISVPSFTDLSIMFMQSHSDDEDGK